MVATNRHRERDVSKETAEKDARLDIVWRGNDVSLDYHFCREWDGDNGCYGTNPDHGHSFAGHVRHSVSPAKQLA